MAAIRHPLLVLVLLGALAFAAVPSYELVWDDRHFLHADSVLAHGSLARLVASDWSLQGPRSGYYRPIVTLTLALESRLSGGSPAVHHTMNVVYHLGAALALVWAALRLLRSPTAAWLAGFAFVVHPVHTESVAWVSGRTDVIAALFFCLAVGAYARAERVASPWMLGALAAAGAAFLSKEPAVVLPAVLLAWEVTRAAPRAFKLRDAARRLAPMCLLLAGYLLLRRLLLGTVAGPIGDAHALSDRLATGVAVIGHYLWLLVVPFPANPDYVLEPLATWSSWSTRGAVAALVGLAVAAGWAWRYSRLPALCLAWFLLTVLPSSPVLPVGPVHMAERFLYLPSAALAFVAGWAGAAALRDAGLNTWRDVRRASEAKALLTGAVMALVLLAGLAFTQYRTEDWRDAERLFTRMAASSPRSWKAANGLGHVYEERGQLAAAAAEYRRAMTLNPTAAAPVISLALVEGRMGLHVEAARHAEAARRLNPEAWRPIAEQPWSPVGAEVKP
jgi:hypothetical protein